eukprot:gene17619-19373_t
MKHEESFTHLEDQCTCCICLSSYEDPAMLSCGHSCCRKCLEEILQLAGPNSKQSTISCPICRKITFFKGKKTLRSLPSNKELQEKLSILTAVSPDAKMKPLENCQMCTLFPKGTAELRCLSCDVYLCSMCYRRASGNAQHSGHHVAKLAAQDDGKNLLLCQSHELRFRYFCRTCDKLMCTECCMLEQHDRIPVKDARAGIKSQVQRILDNVKQKSKSTESALLECKESTQKIENEKIKVRNELRKAKRRVISQILYIFNDIENDYVHRFDEKSKFLKNILQGRLDEAQVNHTKVVSWKDALESTLKIEDDIEFLAKREHVKQNANEVESLSVDDTRTNNFFFEVDFIEETVPTTMLEDAFSCIGEIKVKASRNRRKWQTLYHDIDKGIIDEAEEEDGSNLTSQMKETEPLSLKPLSLIASSNNTNATSLSLNSNASSQSSIPHAVVASAFVCANSASVPNLANSSGNARSPQQDTSSTTFCHRCKRRHTYSYKECHALRNCDGDIVYNENYCFRCGKPNHHAEDCYSRYDLFGTRLEGN